MFARYTFIGKHTLSLYLSSAAGVDLIRTTVCQAELLVRKKMKQYLGLVTEAEGAAEDSNCNTTAEDLQVQYSTAHSTTVTLKIHTIHVPTYVSTV